MTRKQLTLASALLVVGLLLVLSVSALPGADEPEDAGTSKQTATGYAGEVDVEEIHRQVEQAIASVPWGEVHQHLAGVRGILDSLDTEALNIEIANALDAVDLDEVHLEVAEALEEVDWDEIQHEIDEAHSEIEAANLEKIEASIRQALEAVDWEEIQRTVEEATGESLKVLDEVFEELGAGSGVI